MENPRDDWRQCALDQRGVEFAECYSREAREIDDELEHVGVTIKQPLESGLIYHNSATSNTARTVSLETAAGVITTIIAGIGETTVIMETEGTNKAAW
jgi:hypothetical protein